MNVNYRQKQNPENKECWKLSETELQEYHVIGNILNKE